MECMCYGLLVRDRPLLLLMRIAPSFIPAIVSALIRCSVSGVSGQWSETTSDRAKSSESGT